MSSIGIVVGEISGDNLASPLLQELLLRFPTLKAEGIAGPKLVQAGCRPLFPMDSITAMGLIEVLKRIPSIYRVRRQLIDHFLKNPPTVFLGVDSPDFNLGLEGILKKKGIPTVHYVSPTVWAWRRGRIKTIKKSVDLMLTLFPFEAAFYEEYDIPVCYTGHPFADQIPMEIDTPKAKQDLGFSPTQKLIALLPGSRNNEIKYLAESFIRTAKYCYEQDMSLQFIVPFVKESHKQAFERLHQEIACDVPITLFMNQARPVMAACDVTLVTSGTATLEVMLHKKPMVVAYKMHPLTYEIAKRVIKTDYIALPNILAKERLAPEFIQDAVHPETMGKALLERLSPSLKLNHILQRFLEIHNLLRQNASHKAALALAPYFKES